MGDTSHDYKRGDQDIHEQTATFEGFLAVSKWGSLGLAALILGLVVTFCVEGAGPFPGVISAVLLLAVGWFVLRKTAD